MKETINACINGINKTKRKHKLIQIDSMPYIELQFTQVSLKKIQQL